MKTELKGNNLENWGGSRAFTGSPQRPAGWQLAAGAPKVASWPCATCRRPFCGLPGSIPAAGGLHCLNYAN